jgi:hypothetical protein
MPSATELRDDLDRVARLHGDLAIDSLSVFERSEIASERHAILKRLAGWRAAGAEFQLTDMLDRLVDAYVRQRSR